MKPIFERSPDKVWEPTRTENGIQLWASRKWKAGERAAYCRNVLGREPYQFESAVAKQ